MDASFAGPLALAIVGLTAGHAIRVLRWSLLLPGRVRISRFDLLLGLAVGYAANALLPWRIGEALRALMVTLRCGEGRKDQAFASIVASILVERMTDLPVAAAILFAVGAGPAVPLLMLLVCVGLAGFGLGLQKSPRTRRIVWQATLPLNHALRLALAHCAWEFGHAVSRRIFLTPRYLAATLLMWAIYLAAYGALALAIRDSAAQTVSLFLESPLTPLLARVAESSPGGPDLGRMGMIFAFALVPVVAILLVGADILRQSLTTGARAVEARLERTRPPDRAARYRLRAPRERYREQGTYDAFLDDLFSGRSTLATRFGLTLPDTAVVHRFFNGGSDAVTGLIEQDGRLCIAKYAVGAAAGKLREQVAWLDRARDAGLSVTDCTHPEARDDGLRYEMPLVVPADAFYDLIHTGEASVSTDLLRALVARVEAHHRTSLASADEEDIRAYLAAKAAANHAVLVAFLREQVGHVFDLNGEPADLSDLALLADPDWLRAQITHRHCADVHGDLTIDNVIATTTRREDYYLIDPNPENLFNTPFIDWAKLMQSLHLGYETLNRLLPRAETNGLVVPLIRSQRYAALHAVLEAEILARFGPDGLREVYFHEIVHYLRLTPYKIRQNPHKGLVFAGATLLLLRRYRARFGA